MEAGLSLERSPISLRRNSLLRGRRRIRCADAEASRFRNPISIQSERILR
jgi:hypothetical protein